MPLKEPIADIILKVDDDVNPQDIIIIIHIIHLCKNCENFKSCNTQNIIQETSSGVDRSTKHWPPRTETGEPGGDNGEKDDQ